MLKDAATRCINTWHTAHYTSGSLHFANLWYACSFHALQSHSAFEILPTSFSSQLTSSFSQQLQSMEQKSCFQTPQKHVEKVMLERICWWCGSFPSAVSFMDGFIVCCYAAGWQLFHWLWSFGVSTACRWMKSKEKKTRMMELSLRTHSMWFNNWKRRISTVTITRLILALYASKNSRMMNLFLSCLVMSAIYSTSIV